MTPSKLDAEELRELLNMHTKSLLGAVQAQAYEEIPRHLKRCVELWGAMEDVLEPP